MALTVLGSGLLNLYSVIGPAAADRLAQLRPFLPLEAMDSSRSLTVLLGFSQIVLAGQLWQRKRRAWVMSLMLAIAAPLLHLAQGLDYVEAAANALLLAGLWWMRGSFTVRSRDVDWRTGLPAAAAGLGVALVYGVAGFWLLDPVEFGVDFHWQAALVETLRALSWAGNPGLTPRTAHAWWFLDSLELITAAAVLWAAWSFFRPMLYRFSTHPSEAAEAQAIVTRHGRTAQDFFKTSLDKSFFFSPRRDAFLAYRVGANLAVVLGDPVGPAHEMEDIVTRFLAYCRANGWGAAFHQASAEMLAVYEKAGLRNLKFGDDAVVDLEEFSLEGKRAKQLRLTLKQCERAGIRAQLHEAPVPDEVIEQAKQVSDEWLQLPGRRERQFTLGQFDRDYVRGTRVLAAYDQAGRMLGFVNLIPSGRPGEGTLDLMRRRAEGPNGIMDFLIIQALMHAKQTGYTRFSLGMSPMGGFQPGESSTAEERAIHAFSQRLTFVFSFQGLRAYKAKFATKWEPYYIVYQNYVDLARLPLAITRVSELPTEE